MSNFRFFATNAAKQLFTIQLSYRVPLSVIDKYLPAHQLFLNQNYRAGHFLASGPTLKRTGGTIWAQADCRAVVERIVDQDPFIKHRLATVKIKQFSATRLHEKLSPIEMTGSGNTI